MSVAPQLESSRGWTQAHWPSTQACSCTIRHSISIQHQNLFGVIHYSLGFVCQVCVMPGCPVIELYCARQQIGREQPQANLAGSLKVNSFLSWMASVEIFARLALGRSSFLLSGWRYSLGCSTLWKPFPHLWWLIQSGDSSGSRRIFLSFMLQDSKDIRFKKVSFFFLPIENNSALVCWCLTLCFHFIWFRSTSVYRALCGPGSALGPVRWTRAFENCSSSFLSSGQGSSSRCWPSLLWPLMGDLSGSQGSEYSLRASCPSH